MTDDGTEAAGKWRIPQAANWRVIKDGSQECMNGRRLE